MNAYSGPRAEETAGALTRSRRSLDFESMWRSLCGEATVPARADFRPAKAARFLSEIVLLEIPNEPDRRMTVRVVGTAVDARLQINIVQQDYLQYLPERYRDGGWRSVRLMIDHPCGLWQITNLHYERGTSNLVEMTFFPLRGPEGGPNFILSHLNFIGMGSDGMQKIRAIAADTARTFQFLDVGAGVPAWLG